MLKLSLLLPVCYLQTADMVGKISMLLHLSALRSPVLGDREGDHASSVMQKAQLENQSREHEEEVERLERTVESLGDLVEATRAAVK